MAASRVDASTTTLYLDREQKRAATGAGGMQWHYECTGSPISLRSAMLPLMLLVPFSRSVPGHCTFVRTYEVSERRMVSRRKMRHGDERGG